MMAGGATVAAPVAVVEVPQAGGALSRMPETLLAALGPCRSVLASHSRLMVACDGEPDLDALRALGLRGAVQAKNGWHLLFAPEAIDGWR